MLGQLGGFFSGDPSVLRFQNRSNDALSSLLAGGEGRFVQRQAGAQAQQQAYGLAANAGGAPALAARQAALAGAQGQAGAAIQGAQMRQQAMTQGMGEAQRRIEAERARQGMAVGAGMNMAGSALGMFMSDEDAKDEIRDASRAMDEFLSAIDPATFTYNQGPDQGQRRAGVMAQDLERTEVGSTMVQQGQDGVRRVDPQAAMSAMLAAQARLHDRLRALESRSGGAGARDRDWDGRMASLPPGSLPPEGRDMDEAGRVMPARPGASTVTSDWDGRMASLPPGSLPPEGRDMDEAGRVMPARPGASTVRVARPPAPGMMRVPEFTFTSDDGRTVQQGPLVEVPIEMVRDARERIVASSRVPGRRDEILARLRSRARDVASAVTSAVTGRR
jgi:hypothetical protein